MIFLVRHGQTDWNIEHKTQGQLDIPLNNEGRREAQMCAERLKSLQINQIIASDLSRAAETAKIIAKHFALTPALDPRLREIHFGDLQGIPAQNISNETWDVFNHAPDRLHAESLRSLYARTKSFFDQVNATPNTLIVTHGGVIRMALYLSHNPRVFNQIEFERDFLQLRIKNADIFMWDKVNPLKPFPPQE